MKYFIKISDIKIIINLLVELDFQDNINCFKSDFEEAEADVIYDISYMHQQNCKTEVEGKILHEKFGCKIYEKENKYLFVYKLGKGIPESDIIVEVNRDGNRHQVYVPEIYQRENLPVYLTPLLGMDVILPGFDRVMMHASIVRYEDLAILFTGASGIGKSTQAELWKKYKGASVINGDRAILRVDDRIYAYGSPYAGSSGIYKNEFAPVKMIVLLRQGMENKIERISGKEAYRMLFPRFLMTKWNKDLLMKTLELIEIILKKIPVYQLTCRPDKEAVELVHQFFDI